MSQEGAPYRIQLTGIHLNLAERSVTFSAGDTPVAKLSLEPDGLIFEASSTPPLIDTPELSAEQPVAAEQPEGPAAERREPQPTVTRSGKLLSTPKPGRPDRRGHDTAWARFAAHVEGEDEAHLYSATFHRHTAKIALTLERNAAITVEGYVRASTDPAKRMDSLSVIRVLSYPGKVDKPQTGGAER